MAAAAGRTSFCSWRSACSDAAFKHCDWPRAPFVIGIILGPIMELSLHQSLAIWGVGFVFRPVALSLAFATLITVVVSLRRAGSRKGDVGAVA